MQQRRIRHVVKRRSVAPALAVGAAIGLAAGFLLGEFFGGQTPARMGKIWSRWRSRTRARTSVDMATHLQERLDHALGPDGQSIELIPVGRNAVEVTGWVTSRLARSRALRIARESLGPETRLVDSLLVWGEDDRVSPAPPASERESA
jgi:hypothetical protein